MNQLQGLLIQVLKELEGLEGDAKCHFDEFYQFCFFYGKQQEAKFLGTGSISLYSCTEKKKSPPFIELDVAIILWKAILKNRFLLLNLWCTFLEEQYNHSISRDTWCCFLEFVTTVHTDMSNFDPEGISPQ